MTAPISIGRVKTTIQTVAGKAAVGAIPKPVTPSVATSSPSPTFQAAMAQNTGMTMNQANAAAQADSKKKMMVILGAAAAMAAVIYFGETQGKKK